MILCLRKEFRPLDFFYIFFRLQPEIFHGKLSPVIWGNFT
jgi:hypothetical protein